MVGEVIVEEEAEAEEGREVDDAEEEEELFFFIIVIIFSFCFKILFDTTSLTAESRVPFGFGFAVRM